MVNGWWINDLPSSTKNAIIVLTGVATAIGPILLGLGGLLKLLIRKQEQDFNDKERECYDKNVLPFVNTELLFMEISNLKLKVMSGNNLTVEKVVRKIDKDKFSALSYGIFYILEFTNQEKKRISQPSTTQLHFRQPKIYSR